MFATQQLQSLRKLLRTRDRAVVLGAALSFVPIFPACFLAFLLSAINYILIMSGVINQSEKRLVLLSLVISAVFSLLWIYILYLLGGGASSTVNSLVYVFLIFFEWINDAVEDVIYGSGVIV